MRNRKEVQLKMNNTAQTTQQIRTIIKQEQEVKCFKCNNGIIKQQVSLKRKFPFKYFKEIFVYCNLCDFEIKKEFRLSKIDYEIEIKERENLPKRIEQVYIR